MKTEYRHLGEVDKGTFDRCKISVSRQNSRDCNQDSPKECNIHSEHNQKDHQPNQLCEVFECSCHVTYQRGKSNSLPVINNPHIHALKTAFSKRSVPSQSNKFEKVQASLHSAEEGNCSGPVLDSVDFFMDIETRSRSGTYSSVHSTRLFKLFAKFGMCGKISVIILILFLICFMIKTFLTFQT
ncbi:unnamed protein product [Mytilus coruscus]|uniref:Uncharacterized protein n=1 Tax=Mytilus coruscus TaxID=42192 RepID=A0A6J8EG19_MYTCO|nr:unnamed protein product [Mytilus coruscus]